MSENKKTKLNYTVELQPKEYEPEDSNPEKMNFIQRAYLKNEINKKRPGSVQLQGAENIYNPLNKTITSSVGDASLTVLDYLLGAKAESEAANRGNEMMSNFGKLANAVVSEGKKPAVANKIQKINDSNLEIMSKPLSRSNSKKLIKNTMEEVELPTDWSADVEMILKNNKNLSDKQIRDIIEKKLEQFEKDPKLLNNLEATRPDAGTLGHSLDTADVFGKLIKKANPNITQESLDKMVEAAKLHDYGKGTVPNRVLTSKMGRGEGGDRFKVLQPHDARGFVDLVEQNETLPAYYAAVHHSKGIPELLEDNLLKVADIYNALTGDRTYKKSMSPSEAIEEMENMVDKVFSKEAFDILKGAIEDGTITPPKNYKSELDDVYSTKAAKGIRKLAKQKGIKLFDVDVALANDKYSNKFGNNKLFSGLDGVVGFINAIPAFISRPVHNTDELVTKTVSDRLKRKALMDLFKKDNNIYDYNRVKYLDNDDQIDKEFSDRLDDIIELYKF